MRRRCSSKRHRTIPSRAVSVNNIISTTHVATREAVATVYNARFKPTPSSENITKRST